MSKIGSALLTVLWLCSFGLVMLWLTSCSQAQAPVVAWHSVNFPTEAGAPPRKLETYSNIGIRVVHWSYRELEAMSLYAYTIPPTPLRRECVIFMPYTWELAVADYDRLLAHEVRHCTGQLHRVVIKGWHVTNVWLP